VLSPTTASIEGLRSIRVILSIGVILCSLFIIIIARITLDNSEDAFSVILSLKNQRSIAYLDIMSETAKILLLVVFTDWELVVDEVVALDSNGGKIRYMISLKLFELFCKYLLKHIHKLFFMLGETLLSNC
jgi:hypothetical protein